MNSQTITWTALPNGMAYLVDGIGLALSVFAAPRLESDDKNAILAQFPDFLDWPEALFPTDGRREVIFRVQFGTGNYISATRLGPQPDSALWRALFSDATPIYPYEMKDYKNMPIESLPVKNIQSFLKREYTELAVNNGEEFPEADSLVINPSAPFRPLAIGYRENTEDKFTAEILNELARRGYNPAGSVTDPSEITKSFLRAKLFLKPFTTKRIAIEPPEIDFHRMVSLLGDYPYLLRKLGLVHDLQIPIPAKIPTTNNVQVLVTWMPVKSDVGTVNIPASDRRMETRCHVSSSGFYALPRETEPEIIDRMLPLEDKRRYEVVTVDAEGSAIKMLDFASGKPMIPRLNLPFRHCALAVFR